MTMLETWRYNNIGKRVLVSADWKKDKSNPQSEDTIVVDMIRAWANDNRRSLVYCKVRFPGEAVHTALIGAGIQIDRAYRLIARLPFPLLRIYRYYQVFL